MLADKIITKEKFKSFLEKTFINKKEILLLMGAFNAIQNADLHDAVMYLLYNEYITLYEFLYALSPLGDASSDGGVAKSINDLVNRVRRDRNMTFKKPLYLIDGVTPATDSDGNEILIDTSYKYVKKDFIRDHLVSLTLENYKDYNNYKAQMDVIYETLTTEEKTLLNEMGITKDRFIYMVRKQMTPDEISHAEIEDLLFLNLPNTYDSNSELYCGSLYLDEDSITPQVIGKKYIVNDELTEEQQRAGITIDELQENMYYTIGSTGMYKVNGRDTALYAGGVLVYNNGRWVKNEIFNIVQMSEILNLNEYSSNLFKSILNKIEMGTIH